MKDRVVQFPHRYQLVPVAGETNVYDFVPVPGTITEAGTPLNKATLLKDETATLYGLTGEDATVDMALATVGETALTHYYGNVAYTDSIAQGSTLSKTIAIGSNKKFGKLIMRNTIHGDFCGVLIEFCTDNTKTITVGSRRYGGDMAGMAASRRYMGRVTQGFYEPLAPNGTGLGIGSAGDIYIEVSEVYISGTNLRIDFKNTNSTASSSLNCNIDWEVW